MDVSVATMARLVFFTALFALLSVGLAEKDVHKLQIGVKVIIFCTRTLHFICSISECRWKTLNGLESLFIERRSFTRGLQPSTSSDDDFRD